MEFCHFCEELVFLEDDMMRDPKELERTGS